MSSTSWSTLSDSSGSHTNSPSSPASQTPAAFSADSPPSSVSSSSVSSDSTHSASALSSNSTTPSFHSQIPHTPNDVPDTANLLLDPFDCTDSQKIPTLSTEQEEWARQYTLTYTERETIDCAVSTTPIRQDSIYTLHPHQHEIYNEQTKHLIESKTEITAIEHRYGYIAYANGSDIAVVCKTSWREATIELDDQSITSLQIFRRKIEKKYAYYLLASSLEGKITVWSIPHLCDNKADDTLHFVSEVEEGLHFYIRRALISPDLQCVVACSSSDYSMIQRYHRNAADHWDPASSLMDPTFAGGCGPWADLAWSPCGQYLGSIAQSESLFVLWRPDQHRAVCKRNLPSRLVSIAFHPHTQGLIALAGRYGFIYLLDLRAAMSGALFTDHLDNTVLQSLSYHDEQLPGINIFASSFTVAWSDDGQRLHVASRYRFWTYTYKKTAPKRLRDKLMAYLLEAWVSRYETEHEDYVTCGALDEGWVSDNENDEKEDTAMDVDLEQIETSKTPSYPIGSSSYMIRKELIQYIESSGHPYEPMQC